MELPRDYKPEFDSLRKLLLEIAPERSAERLLRKVVQCLANRPHAVMARIWLIDNGDLCGDCFTHPECTDQTRCLHLVASAESATSGLESNGNSNEELKRIPIASGVIGRIAKTGKAAISSDTSHDLSGIGGPESEKRAEIKGFNGQPIIFRDEVLGVLAQYNRIPPPELTTEWLRIFADHIGAAIVNTRAFEEIERLKSQLELENTLLQEEVREAKAFGEMIGESAALKKTMRQIEMVAPTDATVLILGESGTGKELVAREIHQRSRRRERPLIRVNCASIPRELYESEFFGHVKGAFTGAVKDRAGRFEAAQGGTLLLDEVGEIPIELQSKLLRVLQEGQYERVGDERTRTVDVRIIAATNRDLPREVEMGHFRQDLYYRLNVFPIKVAPLRERVEDIPLLAAAFLEKAARKLNVPAARLTQAHLAQFQNYHWPGNVRELQNTIERALILAQHGTLWFELPTGGSADSSQPAAQANPPPCGSDAPILSDLEFRQKERENILAALNKTKWKIHGAGGAAELLGLKPSTLISRIKSLSLQRPERPAS